MKRRIHLSIATGLALFCLTAAWLHADDSQQLSPERLDMVDQLGYFTPGFKRAVRDYVTVKQQLRDATAEQTKLAHELPDLQKQAAESQAKVVAMGQELAKYDHPEENDFTLLQARMTDTNAKLEDQMVFAQAYVWTYPASPHESDAQQYLQQLQKKMADLVQAKKDADTALVAAHAALIKRAQARDLSLQEWRSFLRDMSQDDLVKIVGQPTAQTDGYWIYAGEWARDPVTNRKFGLEINFSAGRVLTVDEKPSPP